jgi:tetratricopeptide (TPR) repeat protein
MAVEPVERFDAERFARAVDELRASDLPDLVLTPAEVRDTLRRPTAASHYRDAIAAAIPEYGPHAARATMDWDQHVLAQWDRTRDRRALRIAVDLWRTTLEFSFVTDKVSAVARLADRFLDEYRFGAELPVLDAAVYLGRDAVFDELAFPDTRPSRLLTVALALRCRYEHTGDREALVESVARYREASRSPGSPALAARGLAAMLAHVRDLIGDGPGLLTGAADPEPDPAAARTSPAAPLAAAAKQASAAAVALAEFRRSGDSNRLTDAVAAARQAVSGTPADHRDRPPRLALVAETLHELYLRRADPAVLDEALDGYRSALALPYDRPELRSEAVVGLVRALRTRHDAGGGRPVHLDEARLLAAEAAARHPLPDEAVAALAELLSTAAQPVRGGAPRLPERLRRPTGSAPEPGDEAVYAAVAGSAAAPPAERGLASQQWARLAAGRGDLSTAGRAYRLTIDLLPELVAALERRDDEEHQLLPFAGLASDAAACALAADAGPEEALDLLERGRCVLLAKELGMPAPRIDPAARRDLSRDGPVVVVNVSRFGSHALLLTGAGIRVLPLPGLTPAGVEDHRIALDVVHKLGRDPAAPVELRRAAGRFVTALLGWLWDVVAGPVLAALGLPPAIGVPPRLWWLATGSLSLLPLHAAGHHPARDGRTVLDRVVSSTTPTLHQLALARSRSGRPVAGTSLVVAASDLPGVAAEAKMVSRVLPGARTLLGPAAVPAAVGRELAGAAWAHFACHATTDPAAPSQSRLVLTGGSLAVTDIARLRTARGHLAYLSACGTARGGDVLTDEVIHVSSAFQLAGFTHVIGTLWPVADDAAARIAEEVYTGPSERMDPAQRLHAALVKVRDEYAGNSPLLWASHLHLGP